mgnify:CR=1 FL=1
MMKFLRSQLDGIVIGVVIGVVVTASVLGWPARTFRAPPPSPPAASSSSLKESWEGREFTLYPNGCVELRSGVYRAWQFKSGRWQECLNPREEGKKGGK